MLPYKSSSHSAKCVRCAPQSGNIATLGAKGPVKLKNPWAEGPSILRTFLHNPSTQPAAKAAPLLLIPHNVIPNILVKDFLIVFHAGLVEGVDVCQGTFVGDGEEEEIHEGSQVEGGDFPDSDGTAHAAFSGQGLFVGLPGGFQHEVHGHVPRFSRFLTGHGKAAPAFFHGNELYQFVFGSLLVFLGEGVHIRGAYGGDGNAAVVDHMACHVVFLSQGFAQKLGVPPAEGAEGVAVGHDDFSGYAVFPAGCIFQGRQEEGGIFFCLFAPAGFFHHPGAGEEVFDVHADEAGEYKAHLGEFAEPAADAVGDGEAGEVVFVGIPAKAALFPIRNGQKGNIRKGDKEGSQGLQGAGGFDGGAGFGNHQKEHPALPACMAAFPLHLFCQLEEAVGIHVLSGKKDFGESVSLFPVHHVPVGAAEYVKEHLVSQVGAADADGNQDVRGFCQLIGMEEAFLFLFRNEHILIQNVGKAGEEDVAAVRPLPAFPQLRQ